ncbi:nuclease-related domain-containing protein [Nonomuraea sp. NPDC004354]
MARTAAPRPWFGSGAGASAHVRYRELLAADRPERLLLRLLLVLLIAVPFGVVISWQAGLVAGAVVAVADTAYRWWTHEAVRTWRQGARGERRTARQLQLLESLGYLVLHDRALPRGRANVDHLVVGPNGVFVVDSKMWRRDRVTLGRRRYGRGGRRPIGEGDVGSALYEAEAVAQALRTLMGSPIKVHALLAVHGRHVPARGIPVAGAHVLRASRVVLWVLHQGRALDDATLARLRFQAARAFPPYVR